MTSWPDHLASRNQKRFWRDLCTPATSSDLGLQTRIAATEKRLVVWADEKLTAFAELEAEISMCRQARSR
jgi:hypothetical protein